MKRLIVLILTLALLASTLVLASCAGQSEDEAKQIAGDLMERAYVLNEAYYGKGLPCDENEHVEGDYYYVSESAPIRVRNDLIVETKAVFSNAIASSLISVYLDGTSNMGVVVFARYITGPSGYLTVYKDYENVVENVTKYDTSTIEITKNSKNKIIFSIKTTNGAKSAEVTLIRENDSWKINSPTY